MRTRSLLLWPFELLAALVRLVFWPPLVAGVCYLALPHAWFLVVTGCLVGYTVVALRIWTRTVRAKLRSMTRGPVTVRRHARRTDRRRPR